MHERRGATWFFVTFLQLEVPPVKTSRRTNSMPMIPSCAAFPWRTIRLTGISTSPVCLFPVFHRSTFSIVGRWNLPEQVRLYKKYWYQQGINHDHLQKGLEVGKNWGLTSWFPGRILQAAVETPLLSWSWWSFQGAAEANNFVWWVKIIATFIHWWFSFSYDTNTGFGVFFSHSLPGSVFRLGCRASWKCSILPIKYCCRSSFKGNLCDLGGDTNQVRVKMSSTIAHHMLRHHG